MTSICKTAKQILFTEMRGCWTMESWELLYLYSQWAHETTKYACCEVWGYGCHRTELLWRKEKSTKSGRQVQDYLQLKSCPCTFQRNKDEWISQESNTWYRFPPFLKEDREIICVLHWKVFISRGCRFKSKMKGSRKWRDLL